LDPSSAWIGRDGANKLLSEIEEAQNSDDYLTLIPVIAARMNTTPDSLLRSALMGPDRKTLTEPTRKSMLAAMAKRPWNAALKVLAWKLGESFIKTSNKDGDVYGHLILAKRDALAILNESLAFKDAAAEVLKRSPKHAQRAVYLTGRLPAGHILSRAKRYGVKLFFAHLFEVSWQLKYGTESPRPFIFTEEAKKLGLDHTHWMHAPNWNFSAGPPSYGIPGKPLPADLPKLP
jgi:hypothetical protein